MENIWTNLNIEERNSVFKKGKNQIHNLLIEIFEELGSSSGQIIFNSIKSDGLINGNFIVKNNENEKEYDLIELQIKRSYDPGGSKYSHIELYEIVGEETSWFTNYKIVQLLEVKIFYGLNLDDIENEKLLNSPYINHLNNKCYCFWEFLDLIEKNKNKYLLNDKYISIIKKLGYELTKIIEESKKSSIDQPEKLEEKRKLFISNIDKDGNEILDVIEGGDDFMSILKLHQDKILEIDKNYVQHFVKISNYLKGKRQNLQDLFLKIRDNINEEKPSRLQRINEIKNKKGLGFSQILEIIDREDDEDLIFENLVGMLQNQIHTYELLVVHSLNMITSLVKNDLITFYEIYESFDKLNIFDSNWEIEVSKKLSMLEVKLDDLMISIQNMESNVIKELRNLSYINQKSFDDLKISVTKELSSINSSIGFNNLLTGINTYQLYKIGKNTKSLRE